MSSKVTGEYLVQDLVDSDCKVISISFKSSIGDALRLLKEHKISALPVYKKDGHYTGYIDVIDIVAALTIAGVSFKVIEAIGSFTVEECLEKEGEFEFASLEVGEVAG